MGVNKNIEKEPKVFNYGDMHLKCHSCGEDVVIFDNVKGGLRVDLYTTDQHKLVLKCDKCNNEMEMYYTEAANPPADTAVEEDQIPDRVPSEKGKSDEQFIDEVKEALGKIDEKIEEDAEEGPLPGLSVEPTESGELIMEEPEDEQIPKEVKTKKQV